MRFMRLGSAGEEQPVVVDDDGQAFDLRPGIQDLDAAFFADSGIERVGDALQRGRLEPIEIAGRRIGPPIARPGAVICIGLNYAAHAAEAGASVPDSPVLFYKAPNTVVGPDDDLVLPPESVKTDWEVELAVVIGRRMWRPSSPEDALEHVAGYAISNDLSERYLQLEVSGGQWSKGKSCPGFNPLGPWLVPSASIPDPQSLRLRSWVNGEPRQDSSTADMIFGVAEILWHLGQVMVLDPGDIVNTGTPEGVAASGRYPFLTAGDEVAMEIDGLGRQQLRVLESPEPRTPHQRKAKP